MTTYNEKLKAIKDAYLDLGVAISELIKLRDAPSSNNKHKKTGCKERVKNAMSNRANQVINIYQMKEILNHEFPLKACGDAMLSLCKDGYLQKIGLGTYKLERIT